MTFAPTLKAEELVAAASTRRIGRTIRSLAEAESTNDLCWQHLAAAGRSGDGAVILADYQTAGRGRFARAWLAPRASSVLLSVVIVQAEEPLLIERLSLMAGVAGCAAARRASAAEIQLRWPNDLVCGRKKVGGVLVESRQYQSGEIAVVIGLGINCLQQAGHFPPEIRHRAASLDMVSAKAISRFALAVGVIQELDRWLSARPMLEAGAVRAAWQDLAEPPGQRVCLIHAGRRLYGTTVELDPTGGLLVQLESGGRRIFDPATTTMEVAD
jgi:BirA family transcriptional regulator, biotin operon repressor / biotin---[acetyl-CoA-carboxylase] ligase